MGTLTLLAAAVCSHALSGTNDELAPVYEHATVLQMLQENNELRTARGLSAQRVSAKLSKAAQDHADYMARTHDFNHHGNGGLAGRANRYGYGGQVRENICQGSATVEFAFRAWRNSGAHWSAIISGASECGFGYAVSKSGRPYWVGVYGYPPGEHPPRYSKKRSRRRRWRR